MTATQVRLPAVGEDITSREQVTALPIGSEVSYPNNPNLIKRAEDSWASVEAPAMHRYMDEHLSISDYHAVVRIGFTVGEVFYGDSSVLPVGAKLTLPGMDEGWNKTDDDSWRYDGGTNTTSNAGFEAGVWVLAALPEVVADGTPGEVAELREQVQVLTNTLEELRLEHSREIARIRTAHEEWKQSFSDAANEYAERKSLCSEYDDFMQEWDFTGRSQDYDVCYDVTVRVCVTGSGTTESSAEDDALEALDMREGRSCTIGDFEGHIEDITHYSTETQ